MTSLTHVEGNAHLQVISLNKNKVLTCTGSSHWLKGLTLISAINLLVILQVCILFLLTHMYSQEIFCLISFTGFSLSTFRSCTYIIKYKKNHEAMSILIWVLLTYFCALEFGGEVLLPFFFVVFFTLLADGKHLLRWVWHVTESRSETPLPSHLLL